MRWVMQQLRQLFGSRSSAEPPQRDSAEEAAVRLAEVRRRLAAVEREYGLAELDERERRQWG